MPVLSNIVGYTAANLNLAPWPGPFATASDFTDTQWTKTGCSITTGVVSPSGATDAQKIVENSGSGNHLVISILTPQLQTRTPIVYRTAFIAKAAERTRVVAYWQCWNGSILEVQAAVGFDLSGGNVGYDTTQGTNATLVDYSMTALGDGWWLCIIDAQYNLAYVNHGDQWEPQLAIDAGSGTAARNVSYTGNGSSGVYVWWFNLLPKAAWNVNHQAFLDDFDDLSTIDLNDTRAPGFNWYLHNLFPNSFMTTFGWSTNPPSVRTPANTFSISSPSILQMLAPNPNQTGWDAQMWSVATDGGNGYVGNVFSPPMLIECYMNWDASSGGFNSNWNGAGPTMWGSTVNALGPTVPPSGRFLEWDMFETASSANPPVRASDTALHDWDNPTTPNQVTVAGSGLFLMVAGTFVRASNMWLPIDDSGFGIFLAFANGQCRINTDFAYSATTKPQPAPGNSVVGQYSEADIQQMPIFLGSIVNATSNPGAGQPFYIDWVKVHTAGSSNQPMFRHSRTGTRAGSRQMA